MSETKFTPGPWRVEYESGDWYVQDENRTVTIADCTSWGQHTDMAEPPSGVGECEANANLIASAPFLYEALRTLLADIPAKRDWLNPDTERFANAALKKARGEA